MRNFSPKPGGRKTITVSASAQRVQLTNNPGSFDVRIVNKGTAEVAIRFGDSAVSASLTTDMTCTSGGSIEVLRGVTADAGGLYVSAIAAGATGDIEFTVGVGS